MQSLHHSMAHRGANATRTNARWHPYTPPRAAVAGASTPFSLFSSSSQHQPTCQESSYLITPAPTVYSISPAHSTFSQSPHTLVTTFQQAATQQPKPPQIAKAQAAKAAYVASLVDQAVKSLTDIWRPENIPPVFSTQTDITIISNSKQPQFSHPQCSNLKRHLVQLPSPSSPSTLPSPPPPPAPSIATVEHARPGKASSSVFPSAFLAEHFGTNAATVVSEKDLVPIRTFVQEVLRRSRTTCSVLQSALCYIEAVRNKVPELVEREKRGLGQRGEPVLDEFVTKEDDDESSSQANQTFMSSDSNGVNAPRTEMMSIDSFDASDAATIIQKDASLPATVSLDGDMQPQQSGKRRKIPAKPLLPLPPLPSPLLCPRRTFLAALILASKFLQDRCYSNRAWAKLSGLPPREVGRCERALGDALGWRLWVGKGAPIPGEEKRGIQRAKIEGTIALGPTSPPESVITAMFPSPPLSDGGGSPEYARMQRKSSRIVNKVLRRAATLPDEAFMRCVPPQYRAQGSLPFSFAVPAIPVLLPLSLPVSVSVGGGDSFPGVL